MSKKSNSATLADLKRLNTVNGKIKENPSKVLFSKIDKQNEIQIMSMGDASYKCDDKSVGGNLVLLGGKYNPKSSPLF